MLKTIMTSAALAAALLIAAPASATGCIGVRVYRPDLPNAWVIVQLFDVNKEQVAACNRVPSGTVNHIGTLAAGQPNETVSVHVGFHGKDGGWFAVPADVVDGLRIVTNETTGIYEGWAALRNDRDGDDRVIVLLEPVQ